MKFVKGIAFSEIVTNIDAVLRALFYSSSVSFDVGCVFPHSKRAAATSSRGIFARESMADESLMDPGCG